MLIRNFEYCQVTKIDNDIAELVFADGKEISSDNIDEIHALLEENLDHPYMILIDKCMQYSYTYKAQMKLGEAPSMKAIAIIFHDSIGAATQHYLRQLRSENPMNLKAFDNADDAMSWLLTQR